MLMHTCKQFPSTKALYGDKTESLHSSVSAVHTKTTTNSLISEQTPEVLHLVFFCRLICLYSEAETDGAELRVRFPPAAG